MAQVASTVAPAGSEERSAAPLDTGATTWKRWGPRCPSHRRRDPASSQAVGVLERIGVGDLDAAEQTQLADVIEASSDRRVKRYRTLLGVLNGCPAFPARVPAFEWFSAALRARTPSPTRR